MFKIGFVDHHLNNYHANKFMSLLNGPLAGRDIQVALAWESDPVGEDWCVKNKVTRAESAQQVADRCDAVMVLAPDNLDAHVVLCDQVLPAGKPTVVDKLLAPDIQSAEKILKRARQYNARIFSASGLRFASELEEALSSYDGVPVDMFARGMGEWDLYGVHTIAMAQRVMGTGIRRLINTGVGSTVSVTAEYADGRRIWVEVRNAANMWDCLPWQFGIHVDQKYVAGTIKDFDGFYLNLLSRELDFFQKGESLVSDQEMLEMVGILEGADRSRKGGSVWLDLAI